MASAQIQRPALQKKSAPENQYRHIEHPIPALYRADSRILILGSFPSVKSREGHFFYHHPQNRFWRVMAALTGETLPVTIEEKRNLLLRHHIALWDVIHSCDIIASSDSSIKNVLPNDLHPILNTAKIEGIYVNGALDCLTALLSPLMNAVGIPPEITPLMILRPLSGSGGLAVGAELMAEHGADSTVGRIASVMLGSSETTFYTVAVYYGAAGILKTRYTIPAALIADLAAFLASVLAVHLFFGL